MAKGLDNTRRIGYDCFMSIGEQIKRARNKAGLSQARLAEIIGCSDDSILNWETKGVIPLPVYMEKLVEILGKQIWEDEPDEQHD